MKSGMVDDDRIDIVGLLVEHLAEVFVLRNLRVLLELSRGALLVHIAERHDVLRWRIHGCRSRPCLPRRSTRCSTSRWAICSPAFAATERSRILRSESRRPAAARKRNGVWCSRMPRTDLPCTILCRLWHEVLGDGCPRPKKSCDLRHRRLLDVTRHARHQRAEGSRHLPTQFYQRNGLARERKLQLRRAVSHIHPPRRVR